MTGTGTDQGKSYVAFVRNNMDIVAKRISDDLWVLNVMEVRKDVLMCFGGGGDAFQNLT